MIEHDLVKLLEIELGTDFSDQKEEEILLDGKVAIDSLTALRLVVSIEDKWGIEIDDDDISDDFFYSIKNMAEIIKRYIHEDI